MAWATCRGSESSVKMAHAILFHESIVRVRVRKMASLFRLGKWTVRHLLGPSCPPFVWRGSVSQTDEERVQAGV